MDFKTGDKVFSTDENVVVVYLHTRKDGFIACQSLNQWNRDFYDYNIYHPKDIVGIKTEVRVKDSIR